MFYFVSRHFLSFFSNHFPLKNATICLSFFISISIFHMNFKRENIVISASISTLSISLLRRCEKIITIFTKKMTYFYQIEPINDIFDNSYANKSDENNFWDSFKKKICSSNHKILTYDLILAPKMIQFWSFSPKMT